MLKTFAPRSLHGAQLRPMLDEMQATPADIAKFLQVTERTVWRWLSENSAPFAVLAAIWHETPTGRHTAALDVGNELVIYRGLAQATQDLCNTKTAQLAKLLAISDTGCANDPFVDLPPPGGPGGFPKRPRPAMQTLRLGRAAA